MPFVTSNPEPLTVTFSPSGFKPATALTASFARDDGAEVPGIVDELTIVVVDAGVPTPVADGTVATAPIGGVEDTCGDNGDVATAVDSGDDTASSDDSVTAGVDWAGASSVTGSAFSPVEQAVTTKYIHTPSPTRPNTR